MVWLSEQWLRCTENSCTKMDRSVEQEISSKMELMCKNVTCNRGSVTNEWRKWWVVQQMVFGLGESFYSPTLLS